MESSSGRAGLQARGWVLVEARLQGGAPWGFTLQGGLEHGEPLIISRVEEGGKASSIDRPLLVGDELIIINDVELTGYRQEAISLVKGSYKTLELTVRRECYPGYFEEPGSFPPSLNAAPPPPPHQQQDHSRTCSAGGVRLCMKNRRSDPASRPHSWHSTKLGEGQQDSGLKELSQGGMGSTWHHSYHASASTTDLSAGFDSGGGYLRKSPDQYSSRGSMESLDPPQSSHHHPGAQHHHHSLSHHIHTGPHPAYSSCHQLSSARSSNSIDHLHSKRDSAYSSFSTSSSIPEYLASAPSFSPERSYSLETVPQREGGSGEMQQADIRYVRTVYDTQQGLSQEHKLSSASAAVLRNSESHGGAGMRAGLGRELQGSAGGVCYRGNSSSSSSSSGSSSGGIPASNRHSVGPIWGQVASRSSYENLKGAPAPPQRSDSYAAIRNHDRHERPNSWSSLENARSLRSLHKGSWHHSSGSVASAKGSYGAEGQLHTVIEKSPESSPTTKPRQGGGLPQPAPSPGPTSGAPGGAPQSGRLMLPTGVYPVPQPEPHYAQMPSSSPSPGSTGVYPALAKESSRQQQQGPQSFGGRDGGVMEGCRDRGMTTVENGYQNNPSPSLSNSHSSSSSMSPTSTQLRTQEADRPQQEVYRPRLKATGGGTEGQVGPQNPQNHQGSHNQSSQGPQTHTNQGPHNQILHGHNQDFQGPQTQSTHGYRPPSAQSMGQERRDPFTPVQPKGDRTRMDQPSIHPEPMVSARVAQGQMAATPPTYQTIHPQPQSNPNPHPSLRHHSNSTTPQHYQHWDHIEREREREHPLTRLEIALVEVQRGTSPDSIVTSSSSQGNGSYCDSNQVNNGNQRPTRSLSVLEKVTRFERRERGGKQRSLSTSQGHDKAKQQKNQPNEKGRSSPCGAEDLRHMLERSATGSKAHRTMSYRGGSSDQTPHRNAADPSSALQRSRSTYQLGEKEDGSPDFPWRQDLQELLGSIPDASSSRAYRDSLKDAQSKVLRSTSFRRRDLSTSVSPPPPPTSPSHSHQPSPVPSMHHSLEKKGPKTMPKPHGLVLAPAALSRSSPPPPVTSPHAPKERHVVSPDVRGPSPPALPSVPPVGPPPSRICGRKRLTAEQKKRSYSEPENMHEVGVSDPETAALFRRGGETSVADRRRMFELAASRSVGGGALQATVTRPELRQLQQDALAEYVERKRGRKREEGGQGRPQRPCSAYLQPETNNHTVSSSYPDSISLSSTSSLLSLLDCGPDQSLSPGERRLCSTLPPGADFRSLQTGLFYPGRVTAPRPQPSAHQPASGPPGSYPEPQAPASSAQLPQDLAPEEGFYRQDLIEQHRQQALGPQGNQGLSKQLNGALQRAGSGQGSGKSASAEDLLERLEERLMTPQHYRSRSSPAVERHNQDLPPGELRMFGVFSSDAGRCSLPDHRATDTQVAGRPVSPHHDQISLNPVQSPGLVQDPSNPPVTRRERQRNGDRQRALSASTLAASVGLPCPFSPPGTPGSSITEWQASERLSQANLDAITFPCTLRTGTGDGEGAASDHSGSRGASSASGGDGDARAASVVRLGGQRASQSNLEHLDQDGGPDPPARHRLSDSSQSGETWKERAFNLGMGEGDGAEKEGPASPKTPSPQPHILPSASPHRKDKPPPPLPSSLPSTLGREERLSSLRISESSLSGPVILSETTEKSVGQSQEDLDEVFLQHPDPPSPPPQIREMDIMEDFPPPSPLALLSPPTLQDMVQDVGQQSLGSSEYLDNPVISPSLPLSSLFPPPMPSLPLPVTTPYGPDTQEAEDSLGLQYQPLPRREKSAEELRVEALARQLVLQDRSLAPLLDTWRGKTTVDLMEDIFHCTGLGSKSPWQCRGSSRLDDRVQDGVCSAGQSPEQERGAETDLDEEEKDVDARKVALCEALRLSVAALRQEKEVLAEEQRSHRALGSSLEVLVQDRCKINEKDKYRMFIGDLERIVNLLLSLCSRLARIDKTLLDAEDQTLEHAAEERESLHQKRSQLLSQTEDARELKENLDRRQRVVQGILSGYLTAAQLRDYQRYVSIKPSLLIRKRQLDDLIRQGEEQLSRLAESLPPELGEPCGWSRGCPLPSSPTPSPCPFPSLLPGLSPGHANSVRSTTVTSL